jgi:hypothetical protein
MESTTAMAVTARHVRLVGHDHEAVAGRLECRERLRYARQQLEFSKSARSA